MWTSESSSNLTQSRTSALGGSPILFHDLEGTPPYPEILDDEYITRNGTIVPPGVKHNPAVEGCLTVLELFRILYSVTVRHRAHKNCPEKLVYTSPDGQLQWTEASIGRIDELLEELPEALKILRRDDAAASTGLGDDLHAIGIQQANIHVTALVTKLALVGSVLGVCPQLTTRSTSRVIFSRAVSPKPKWSRSQRRVSSCCQGRNSIQPRLTVQHTDRVPGCEWREHGECLSNIAHAPPARQGSESNLGFANGHGWCRRS